MNPNAPLPLFSNTENWKANLPPGTVAARDLSKHYTLYPSPLAKLRATLFPGTIKAKELIALEKVNFQIEPATALGVIGPNGAGKSTLLKMLSGVLTPSSGDMAVVGRVASIIELGAGFHPEFSGRDNVLMNAEFHGLTPQEALERVDSIAAFSELGRYFDMPVRTYSSGMFVRLAFSLAVSVDPDVLLVDEALAVGDAVFVHRCLSRIRELRERGVTIFLVTHDTATVANLCDRALLIHSGRLAADGTPKEVIHRYLVHIAERLTKLDQQQNDGPVKKGFHTVGAHEEAEDENGIQEMRFGSFEARITECTVEDLDGHRIAQTLGCSPVILRMNVRFERDVEQPIFGVMVRNRFGVEMFGTNTYLRQDKIPPFRAGEQVTVRFQLPLMLDSGAYAITYAVHAPNGDYYDYRTDAVVVEVIAGQDSGGLVRLPTQFHLEYADTTLENNSDDENPLNLLYQNAPTAWSSQEAATHPFGVGALVIEEEGVLLAGEARFFLKCPRLPDQAQAQPTLEVVVETAPDKDQPSLEVWLNGHHLALADHERFALNQQHLMRIVYRLKEQLDQAGEIQRIRIRPKSHPIGLLSVGLFMKTKTDFTP